MFSRLNRLSLKLLFLPSLFGQITRNSKELLLVVTPSTSTKLVLYWLNTQHQLPTAPTSAAPVSLPMSQAEAEVIVKLEAYNLEGESGNNTTEWEPVEDEVEEGENVK